MSTLVEIGQMVLEKMNILKKKVADKLATDDFRNTKANKYHVQNHQKRARNYEKVFFVIMR